MSNETMGKRILLALVAGAVVAAAGIVAGGCAPPYRRTFDDEARRRNWTEKQKLAAFAYADRIFWARRTGENQYAIVYGRVPTGKVRAQLESVLRDFNGILDPKNSENRKYIDALNLRKDMEHDEEVAEATYARVRAAELDIEFRQDIGEIPSYGPEAEMAAGYNLRKIFLAKDLATAFPFTSAQIEGAKKDGTLKVIETAEFDLSRAYDRKEADPAHVDDPNEFVWKAATRSIRLVDYKIIATDKPDNNQGDYIEGTVVADGKPESKPRLKVFFPQSAGVAVVLIDTDKEGDPGFGVPDILDKVYNLSSVRDIIRQGSILDTLFQEKPKTQRVAAMPPVQLFKIEIARIGTPVDVWEKAPSAEGWIVPFKYQTTMGNNFNIRIGFQGPKVDPNDPDAAHAHSEFLKIEYIEKEYTLAGQRYQASQGAVTEYYRPKAGFDGPLQARVLYNEDSRKLDFIFPDGSEVTGFVTPGSNKFIEDAPYAKAYTEGGQRYWIEKSPGSGVFDKRKRIAAPKDRVGEYSDYRHAEPEEGTSDSSDEGEPQLHRRTPVPKPPR